MQIPVCVEKRPKKPFLTANGTFLFSQCRRFEIVDKERFFLSKMLLSLSLFSRTITPLLSLALLDFRKYQRQILSNGVIVSSEIV
jgi:hypothetical protein